ncbi:MAG: TraB/GumN family protein [Candidatus Woesearchaeota archaeon]
MDFKNLKIIGTSHISKHSMKEVENEINNLNPFIVAVELDKQRLDALMNEGKKSSISFKSIKEIGFKGFFFALIANYVSKKLGKLVGVTPGSDMKHAVIIASKNKIKVSLIDQDIKITLRRISKFLTWKERFRFVADIFNGIFFKKKQMKKYNLENFDLNKVPDEKLIEKLISYVEKRYPSLYKVIIHERNIVMSKRLIVIMKKNPEQNILAVVGAGHKKGMLKLIKEYYDKIEVV